MFLYLILSICLITPSYQKPIEKNRKNRDYPYWNKTYPPKQKWSTPYNPLCFPYQYGSPSYYPSYEYNTPIPLHPYYEPPNSYAPPATTYGPPSPTPTYYPAPSYYPPTYNHSHINNTYLPIGYGLPPPILPPYDGPSNETITSTVYPIYYPPLNTQPLPNFQPSNYHPEITSSFLPQFPPKSDLLSLSDNPYGSHSDSHGHDNHYGSDGHWPKKPEGGQQQIVYIHQPHIFPVPFPPSGIFPMGFGKKTPASVTTTTKTQVNKDQNVTPNELEINESVEQVTETTDLIANENETVTSRENRISSK